MATTYRGKPACECLAAWCPAFEDAIGRQPRLFQLAGDATASAGFHRGGGSADYEPLSEEELRIARNMGAAAWNRLWSNNFHSHLRLNGCPHNSLAQPQVEDLNEGRDGTGPLWDNAGRPDDGPRDNVRWPLRTWQQGIEWAKARRDWLDMATKAEVVAATKAAIWGIEIPAPPGSKAERHYGKGARLSLPNALYWALAEGVGDAEEATLKAIADTIKQED